MFVLLRVGLLTRGFRTAWSFAVSAFPSAFRSVADEDDFPLTVARPHRLYRFPFYALAGTRSAKYKFL